MRGEGWLYGLAFVGLLGAGAALIVPRLQALRTTRSEPAASAGRPVRPPTQARAPASGPALADLPAAGARRVSVLVTGEGGALRGPLKAVVGALSEAPEVAEDGSLLLRLTLGSGEVALGAAGHRWVRRAGAELVDGERILLPEATLPLVLKVREGDGSPAPNVPVDVRPPSPLGTRRTDAGGTLVLDDLGEGLVAIQVGGVERQGPGLRLLAGRDREARVVLDPPWEVGGLVLGPGGEPWPEAVVEGFDARGPVGRVERSDREGRFRWQGPACNALCLRVSAPGRARVSLEAVPPMSGPLRTDVGVVRLSEEEVEVVGRVRGGRGRSGAEVLVEPRVAALLRELFGAESVLEPGWRQTLNAEGEFSFRGLPAEVPLRLSLRGAGVPEDALLSPRAGDRISHDFEPVAGERLEVVVFDTVSNAPAVGLEVLVSTTPRDGDLEQPGDRRAVTDEQGRLRLEGLDPVAHFLRAYRPGRRSLLHRIELPQDQATRTAELVLVAALSDAGRRLVGSVVDETGVPLAGVTVRAAGVTGRTGDDGQFALEGVESMAPLVPVSWSFEGGARLEAATDPRRHSGVGRSEASPGGPPLRLVLPRDMALRMRLLDGLDDQPLSFVWVVVRAEGGRVLVDRGAALVEGRLMLSQLPRVPLSLSLFAPGRRLERAVALEALRAAGADELVVRDLGDLRLARGLAVHGVVTDRAGRPQAGARVAALDEGWLGALRRDPTARRESALRIALSDAQGRYRLEGLDPARPAALAVWAPGHAPTLRRALVERPLAPGEASTGEDVGSGSRVLSRLEVELDVRLRPGTRVSLLLSDGSSREPLPGAVVDLESARNGSSWLDLVLRGVLGGRVASTTTWRAASEHLLFEGLEPGVYAIGPVEPGEYELHVEHPQFVPERRKIPVLDPGDPLSYEALEMEPGVVDPNDPNLARRLRRGPEMVTVYGSDKMRLHVELTPR